MSVLWFVVLAFAIFYFVIIVGRLYTLYRLNSIIEKIEKINTQYKNSIDELASHIYPLAPEINDLNSNPYAYISRTGGKQDFIDSFNTSRRNLYDLADETRYYLKRIANPLYSFKLFILFTLQFPSYFIKLLGFNINIKVSKIINAISWFLLIFLDVFFTHFAEYIFNQFMNK